MSQHGALKVKDRDESKRLWIRLAALSSVVTLGFTAVAQCGFDLEKYECPVRTIPIISYNNSD